MVERLGTFPKFPWKRISQAPPFGKSQQQIVITKTHLQRTARQGSYAEEVKIISTWLFTGNDQRDVYSQMRGNPRSEVFHDVYRQCIFTFFMTAKRASPEAKLILYLDEPWMNRTDIESKVADKLDRLGVETRVIAFQHAPPSSFAGEWRNQFFIFDVLADLNQMEGPDSSFFLLDSDTVWASKAGSEKLFLAASEKLCVMPVGYFGDWEVNGQSSHSLARSLGLEAPVEYFGGELVAGPVSELPKLLETIENFLGILFEAHLGDKDLQFEEAHVLSAAYQAMETKRLEPADARRMWTQPFRYRNTKPGDEMTTLWHTPAEKRYGLARLYQHLSNQDLTAICEASDPDFRAMLGRFLGVPRNSHAKLVSDVLRAIRQRLVS